ncbi:unnamed protein product [Cylicocyclus nassatus]|uniref:Uncharacterized protein n=1 Tax=Cylicocyclus nassatus TaxID=53992 RepID=A0AA36GUT0_CYLNA|nr:unnamed protein product [Cylicocyclus nassatus]
MRKAIHIAGILILLVGLEAVWGEEETKEERAEASGEGEEASGKEEGAEEYDELQAAPAKKNRGGNAAEENPKPPLEAQEPVPVEATNSPKKLGRMVDSIVPVIVAVGAASL